MGWAGVREAFFQTGFSTRHWRAVLRETLGGSWETEEGGKEALENNAEGRVGILLFILSKPEERPEEQQSGKGDGTSLWVQEQGCRSW